MISDSTPVPSLGRDGWVTDTPQKCDLMLSHFFVAEETQSHFFGQAVSSLTALLKQYQDDQVGLAVATQDTLKRYYGNFFPKVEVKVTCDKSVDNPNKYALHVYVLVTDLNGVEFSLAKVADFQDAKILKIIALNDKY